MKKLFNAIGAAADMVGSRITNKSSESYDSYEYDDSEALSVWDATDIWMSSGMDEDYTFGYSEEELRDAM